VKKAEEGGMKGFTAVKKKVLMPVLIAGALGVLAFTQKDSGPGNIDCEITIDASLPQLQMSSDMYGIFFEDINHAADGGLYAELIQNRDFEAGRTPENITFLKNDTVTNFAGWKDIYKRPSPLQAWSLIKEGDVQGSIEQTAATPLNDKNPMSMKFEVSKLGRGKLAVSNEGFWGINVEKGKKYFLSLYARKDAKSKGSIKVSLESKTGKVYAEKVISGINEKWSQYKTVLLSSAVDSDARFVIAPLSEGTLWFDVVSLFPPTWKNRPNGLRSDLAQMLKDMNPSFLRFPGGCVVEGATIENRIQWKNTIGDIAGRPGHWNLWAYHTYDGIGFHEFLQMCEDLNAEPLYVVNVGMACQYRGGLVDKGEIKKYINETLDALEYAMGPVTSKWGAMRAKNGHPKPFKIKYLEIGNENWGQEYITRYYEFFKAVKEKYPQIITIADGDLEKDNGKNEIEMVDEHYYLAPNGFYKRASMYDSYDRNRKRRIYIGEFAVTSGAIGKGNLRGALAESAYMIGMERNADMVKMASYAPTFVNANNRNWNPDMIVFNSSKAYGTPSYQAIKMFSGNRPEKVLNTNINVKPDGVKKDDCKGGIALGTWGTVSEYKDVKVAVDGREVFSEDFSNGLNAWKAVKDEWSVVDGALRNKGNEWETLIMGGSYAWKDYTLTVKARKIKGDEGFAVGFYVNSAEDNYRWNIGGWGNTETGVQYFGNGTEDVSKRVKVKIETGKWYDIKIETKGNLVKCYLDGALIHDFKLPEKPQPKMYATSGISKNKDEIIIKVVNPLEKEKAAKINLKGLGGIEPKGEAYVLSSSSQDDENSFENPVKVAPKKINIDNAADGFVYNCPANSLSIIKLKIVKGIKK
jgi:alpha-L-arabinofuranosidase